MDAVSAGLYVAAFRLDADRRIRVGRLGRFQFRRGVYLYVGSAQRDREARLARHTRRRKPLRWHIDYLSAKATMLGAILVPGGRDAECALAAEVGKIYPRFIDGFGASDCRCGGHLFYAGQW